MADTISISLNNIQNVKNVLIEGLGEFKVRKLGAGEELDLSTKMRRLMAIAKDVESLGIKNDGLDNIDEKTLSKLDKYTEEINSIKKFELETYKKCFVDDNNGKNVEYLVNALSDQERAELFKQIFGEIKAVEDKNA